MDVSQIAVTTGGIGLIGFTLWFFLGSSRKGRKEAKEGAYGCPMHPWITSSDPGAECPVCGMKLVKRERQSG